MSEQYTITKAARDRTYESKYGDMVVWKVRLDGAATDKTDGVFELHKKPGNEPKAGDTLEVERTQEGEFDGAPFVRIYLAKPQNTGGGNSSRGGGRGGDDPAVRDSIERQTAANCAARMAAASPASSGVVMQSNFEELFGTVLGKIQGAPPQQTLNGGGGEVPADTRELAPAAAGTDDGSDIPF